jgi:hypothetical protein
VLTHQHAAQLAELVGAVLEHAQDRFPFRDRERDDACARGRLRDPGRRGEIYVYSKLGARSQPTANCALEIGLMLRSPRRRQQNHLGCAGGHTPFPLWPPVLDALEASSGAWALAQAEGPVPA